MSWFWVILFMSAILFLRGLLTDLHVETTRLAGERERFQKELEEEREKMEENRELYWEFYAQLNENIKKAIEALNDGEIPNGNFDLSPGFRW